MPHAPTVSKQTRIARRLAAVAERMGQAGPDQDAIDFVAYRASELEDALKTKLHELGYAVTWSMQAHPAFGDGVGQISADEADLDDHLILKLVVPRIAEYAAVEIQKVLAGYVQSKIRRGRCSREFVGPALKEL